MPSLVSLLSLAPLALTLPFVPRQSCPTGVHIIAARGSTEAPGEGKLQELSDDLEAQIPGSSAEAVIYPATLLHYESSEESGVSDMTELITNFVDACPDARIVLTGFSQGAHVIGDVLGGGTFQDSAPLPEQYRSNILAAVLFGDPSFQPGKSYDFGNATHHGLFPRKDTTQLDTYSAQLASYCLDGDPVCSEGIHLSHHTEEVETYQSSAMAFVLGLAQGSGFQTKRSFQARYEQWS